MYPITIIGSGLAGYTVARELRKFDKNLPLRIITADEGHFYSKPMLSNAFAQHKTLENLISVPVEIIAEQLHAEILTHTLVTKLLPQQHRVDLGENSIQYSQLVLACGAEPIRLPLAGHAADKVLSVNNLSDYRYFRAALQNAKRIAIMGAGLIGCEFANDLQQAGFAVTVIDLATHPLGRLVPKVVGEALQRALQELGVTWQLEKTVNSIEEAERGEKGYRLTLSDGSQLEAEVVVSAVGLRPRTELAASAGLVVERGIVVNRYLQTALSKSEDLDSSKGLDSSNIYALGDCAQVEGLVLPFVMPLINAGRALAKTLAGELTAVTYPAMPVVVKTPACPIVVSPPAVNREGDWEIQTEGRNIRALFYTPQRQLGGFVLTGTVVAEKMAWTKLVPAVLE